MRYNIEELKQKICKIGKLMYERDLTLASDGNISCRLDDNRFLITPTRICKGEMQPEDLVVIDKDMHIVDGSRKPSTEMMMHLKYYELRPDISAVIHAHSPYAVAFAISRQSLMKPVIPAIETFVGRVPCAAYGTPGTPELVNSIAKYACDYNAVLLANHGSITAGTDLQDAFFKLERLEFFCRTIYYARQMGGEYTLNDDEVQRIWESF